MSSAPHWEVVVTCGGTGGHVLPALAMVDALEDAGVARDRVGFVGGLHGQETKLVPAAGVDFVGFDVRGLRRSLSPKGMGRNVAAVAALGRAVRRARALVKRSGARVVLGMGGYASLPATLGAGRHAAVVLYESNSTPGLAVRLAARRAVLCGCAFESTVGRVPRGERVGFLVRPSLQGLDKAEVAAEARAAYGVDAGRRVLAVMGGSQGARSLNDAVVELVGRWRDRGDLAIVHLVGARDYDSVVAATRQAAGGAALQYVPLAFEERVERVYALASLFVCRAGASTCAELCTTGTAAVLVPYPFAADDHQTKNAAELEAVGAAELLADADVSADTLGAAAGPLLAAPERVAAMGAAAAGLGSARAGTRLAQVVLDLLNAAPTEVTQT